MAHLRKDGRPWLRGTGASRRRAGTISATPADAPKAIRRARRRLTRNAAVGTLVGLAVLAGALAGLRAMGDQSDPAARVREVW